MSTPTTTPVTYGRDASVARFSVARYQRMIETGILTPDDRVELLENYLVLKTPHNPPHDGTIDLIKAAIGPKLPAGWLLRVQQTVVLPDSQPEPDFSIGVTSPAYGSMQTYQLGDNIPPVLDGVFVETFAAVDLLP